MLEKTIHNEQLEAFQNLLDNSQNIVITCHMSPDGDAIGSTLGASILLSGLGKNTLVITPDKAPADLSFLPEFDKIIAYTESKEQADNAIANADLILCLDYNGLNRVAEMATPLANAQCPKVMIDHHLHPDTFCDVIISYPSMTSTCELLFRVLYQMGLLDKVNTDAASCIYTGMMTDTGNFSYNSNHAELYIIVAELIRKGIDKDRICKLAMRTNSESRMRLNGYALAEKMVLYPEHRASLIVLEKEDLERFNYQRGDTEMLANMPLAIPEVIWSTFFRQEADYVKVSMRSEEDFKVNTLCSKYFNGGGHANAAGGEFRGTMEEAIQTYLKVLEDLNETKNNQ